MVATDFRHQDEILQSYILTKWCWFQETQKIRKHNSYSKQTCFFFRTTVKSNNICKFKTLKILHLNVRSMKNKVLLEVIPCQEQPDNFCCSEHWYATDQINKLTVTNYHLMNYYCKNDIKCGGTNIYARPDIKMKAVSCHEFCT